MGDRVANLRTAVKRLNGISGITVACVSPVYETKPVGGVEQPDFYNAAAIITAGLDPRQLLDACMTIENEMGRVRTQKWGPRIIDIDILLYGGVNIDEHGLQIPHPLMAERAFVLYPLADIAPDAVHPVLGKTVAELREEIPDEGISFVSGLKLL